jgi:outer membrane protein TolC
MTISSFSFRQAGLARTALLAVVAFSTAFFIPPTRALSAQDSALQHISLPLSPIEKAEKDGSSIHLSLKDITKLALQNNLDIAISDTNEALYQQKLMQAYGPYDPAISLALGVQSFKQPNTNLSNQSTQGGSNKTDYASWNLKFTKNLPSGGGIMATYNSSRSDTNQAFALFSPQFNASATVQVIQPLRRNFRIDQYRGTIKLANLDLEINDSQFRQKVLDTIARIQAQYWDLIGAIRDYEIRRESVKLAQITIWNNKKKVEYGTLAPIGITEAEADAASREVDLIAAEERVYNVENALRALISNDRNAEIWQKIIVPTDAPDFQEYKVDLDQAIDAALKNRTELEQVAIKMKQADIGYQFNKDQMKWQFDLVGSFGVVGVSGPQSYITDPNTGEQTMVIDPNLVGGIGNAYKTLFTGGFTNWGVGFNVQIPLRNRSVEAQLGQIQVQKRQLLMNRKQLEQGILVDVRNAVQRIETNRKQVETARVARELAQKQLDGEEQRFQAGLSENFRVLDRQRALSSAQGIELQALIAYKKSIITLQWVMNTLLEANEFEIAKTSAGNVPESK